MSFNPANEKQNVICERKLWNTRAVESEHQKLVSELCTGRNKTECAWHASMGESRVSDRFLVNTQVQSHALLRRGFGTSVPFIVYIVYMTPVFEDSHLHIT